MHPLSSRDKSRASASEAVSFKKLTIMQVANTFAATTTPAGVGGLALSTRFLQKAGLGALRATAAVALTGPIGFVGLTAPHLARSLVGSDHRWLLPASGLIGGIVLLACDVVGRLIGGNGEVPVGVVLSVLGGICFVLIVRRGRMAVL